MFLNADGKIRFFAIRGQVGIQVLNVAVALVTPPWRIRAAKYRGGATRVVEVGPVRVTTGAA